MTYKLYGAKRNSACTNPDSSNDLSALYEYGRHKFGSTLLDWWFIVDVKMDKIVLYSLLGVKV